MSLIDDQICCAALTPEDGLTNNSMLIARKVEIRPPAAARMPLRRLLRLPARVSRDLETKFAQGDFAGAKADCAIACDLTMTIAAATPRSWAEARRRLVILTAHRAAFGRENAQTIMLDTAIAQSCLDWNVTLIDANDAAPATTMH